MTLTRCSYLNETHKSIQHNEINYAVSVVVTKHTIDIMAIQEEVRMLKNIIETMKEKLSALEKVLK